MEVTLQGISVRRVDRLLLATSPRVDWATLLSMQVAERLPYLRLYGPGGSQVAYNDDSCYLSSYLTYTVPANAGGTYVIRAGCYSSQSCSGNVVYTTY